MSGMTHANTMRRHIAAALKSSVRRSGSDEEALQKLHEVLLGTGSNSGQRDEHKQLGLVPVTAALSQAQKQPADQDAIASLQAAAAMALDELTATQQTAITAGRRANKLVGRAGAAAAPDEARSQALGAPPDAKQPRLSYNATGPLNWLGAYCHSMQERM